MTDNLGQIVGGGHACLIDQDHITGTDINALGSAVGAGMDERRNRRGRHTGVGSQHLSGDRRRCQADDLVPVCLPRAGEHIHRRGLAGTCRTHTHRQGRRRAQQVVDELALISRQCVAALSLDRGQGGVQLVGGVLVDDPQLRCGGDLLLIIEHCLTGEPGGGVGGEHRLTVVTPQPRRSGVNIDTGKNLVGIDPDQMTGQAPRVDLRARQCFDLVGVEAVVGELSGDLGVDLELGPGGPLRRQGGDHRGSNLIEVLLVPVVSAQFLLRGVGVKLIFGGTLTRCRQVTLGGSEHVVEHRGAVELG